MPGPPTLRKSAGVQSIGKLSVSAHHIFRTTIGGTDGAILGLGVTGKFAAFVILF